MYGDGAFCLLAGGRLHLSLFHGLEEGGIASSAVTNHYMYRRCLYFHLVLIPIKLSACPKSFETMSPPESSEGRPLLRPYSPTSSSSSSSSEVKYLTITPLTTSEDEITSESLLPQRITPDVPLPESSPLGRTLTWSSSFILVISRVIGSGIFATPGTILTAVHSPGLALLLWLVGAVIAACGLAVSLEFGTMLPRSGGDKVYLEFVYRRPRFLASTLIAVHAVLLGFTASNCVVFSRYVLFALGWEDTAGSLAKKAVAVGLLCAITIIHVVFPKAGVRLQDGLGWMKIGLVMFMILSGIYAILAVQPPGSSPGARSQLALDGLWEGSVWNWGIVSTSLFKVFYSYAGLDNVNNVLNEVKNPVRTVRSVTLTALAMACGMYLLVNVAYMLVVPLEEIRGSGELVAALFFERVFGVRLGRRILPLAVATSAAGNVLVVAFAMVSLASFVDRHLIQAHANSRHDSSKKSPGKASCRSQRRSLPRNHSAHRSAGSRCTSSPASSSLSFRPPRRYTPLSSSSSSTQRRSSAS